MYRYIQIGSDAAYSQSLPRERIGNSLRAFSEVMADRLHGFKNSDTTPWFRINIGSCDANGNYPAGRAQNGAMANMIELIYGNAGDAASLKFYQDLADRIAEAVGWNIVEDSE
ncbi:MAG: hypothetical protein R3B94_09335 [Hyphomonas sp.]